VRALPALLLSLLVGCATNPARPGATLPAAARADPSGYLVVTVRNPVAPPPPHAASTPRGYDGAAGYRAGGQARGSARGLAADYSLVEVSSWPIALLGVHCLLYAIPPGADPSGVAAALRRDERVESVQPLQTFRTASASYNDPYAPLQANVAQMAIAGAHQVSRGVGVRVAVIDTGADVSHPDLRPHGATSRNFVDTDAMAFMNDGHGTAVVGMIGAVPNNGVGIVGIAPEVEFLVYKACWRDPAGSSSARCNSFTLAQALAAAIEARVDIINLSLGGPSDPLLARLMARGLKKGVIVVGAVPRDGSRNGFPVEVDGVIAVDALEAGHKTPGVLSAPGRDVLSLAPAGHYDFFSGSSLAAAEISGLIALLKTARPQLTAHEAQTIIAASAAEATGPNACAALAMLNRHADCARGDGMALPAGSAASRF